MDPAPYRKLSNEAHRKLDEVVLSEIAWLLGGPNAVPLPTTLLGTIVACAPQCLAQDRSELQSKYAAHKDKFDDLLLNCWNMKSFARVRNLAILQATPQAAIGDSSIVQADIYREEQWNATENAWKATYNGTAQTRLHNVLLNMNQHRPRDRGYANVVSIIQSSGTGKSRMVDELARTVFTIPFNLREEEDNYAGAYPLPDSAPRDFFLESVNDKSIKEKITTKARSCAFIIALFQEILHVINSWSIYETPEDLAHAWRDYLALPSTNNQTNRDALYSAVVERAYEICQDLAVRPKTVGLVDSPDSLAPLQDLPSTPDSSQSSGIQSSGNHIDLSQESLKYVEVLAKDRVGPAAANFQTAIRGHCRRGRKDNKQDLILVYFDESHVLHQRRVLKDQHSVYMNLLWTLDLLKGQDMFSLFLSTNSNLSKYAPTRYHFPSLRVHEMDSIQPPFTELSFDCHPKLLASIKPGTLTLADVSSIKVMCWFGRALWYTRYEYGSPAVRDNMIDFAFTKLAWGLSDRDEEDRRRARLAVLATRLLLNFEPARKDARKQESKLVENRMRVAYSVPAHREYMHSGYPSEPILAEAAARGWEALRVRASQTTKTPEARERAEDDAVPKVLKDLINDGLIDKGERGELVARLLLISAIDKAVKRHSRDTKGPSSTSSLIYGSDIPLSYFLEELFGKSNCTHIAESVPAGGGDVKFKDAFKTAHIRFSHFGRASDDVAGASTDAAYAAVLRGMAIQCRPGQETIDLVLPIVLHPERPLEERIMTAILVSIKDRTRSSSRNSVAIDASKINFFPEGDESGRPYIALVMELGVQPPGSQLSKTAVKKSKPKRKRARKATAGDVKRAKNTGGRPITPPAWPTAASGNATPSRIVVQATALRRSERHVLPQHSNHPRYDIYAYGCSPTVYGVVKNKHTFARLLGSRGFLAEHPRQDAECIASIRQMKPMWTAGPDCYSWVQNNLLNTSLRAISQSRGGIHVGVIDHEIAIAERGDNDTGDGREDEEDWQEENGGEDESESESGDEPADLDVKMDSDMD